MKKAISIIILLISLPAFSEVNLWGGVEYGLGLSEIDKKNEKFDKGSLLGGKVLGSYNMDKYLVDFGLGAAKLEQTNKLSGGGFGKVELESTMMHLHLSPKLKLTETIHAGLFYDHYLGDGLLVSQDNTSVNSVGGISLTYEKNDVKLPFRVGVSYETDLHFSDDVSHNVAKAFFQIGFPLFKKPAPAVKSKVEKIDFIASNFSFDSYKLPVYNLMKITALARILKGNEDWELVIVEGHTDSVGEEKYNINLSKLRADSAFQIFKQEGLPESKIRLVYKGESDLLVKENSRADRRANRRIEIEIRSKDKALLQEIKNLFESK